MRKYTDEELVERHRTLMREKYRRMVRAEQLELVRELVSKAQNLSYEQAVEFVQNHYRVKEFKQGE